MKRIVLALLALLGLVTQTATVQARVCGEGTAQVGLLASTMVVRKVAPAHEVAHFQQVDRAIRPDFMASRDLSGLGIRFIAPPVLTGIDRSRE